MKFRDPLATLNFLGGSLPNHVAMAIFSGYSYYYHLEQINCPDVSLEDLDYQFDSIFGMFLAHALYVVLYTIKKCFSKQTDHGTYIKVFLVVISMGCYLAAYLYIQFRSI